MKSMFTFKASYLKTGELKENFLETLQKNIGIVKWSFLYN